MDVCSAIKVRLQELGLDQKGLAEAAEVTESYVSQLLTGKKLPPAPDRTDIYSKMAVFLQLSNGELEKLARAQRIEALKREYEAPHGALLEDTRALVLRKCVPARRRQIQSIFERQPFGELEQLVTRKLLEVVSRVARSELDNQDWLLKVATLGDKSHEQMRVTILEFLDTDIFNISNQDCVSFLDPLIVQWDIDITTFNMEITLNEKLAPGMSKKFAFVETHSASPRQREPGFTAFLEDAKLSVDVTQEEDQFLSALRFRSNRPNKLYYYRALQILRDPVHFFDM